MAYGVYGRPPSIVSYEIIKAYFVVRCWLYNDYT